MENNIFAFNGYAFFICGNASRASNVSVLCLLYISLYNVTNSKLNGGNKIMFSKNNYVKKLCEIILLYLASSGNESAESE